MSADTLDIVVVMGNVYDYFRPVPDSDNSKTNKERFCKMLKSSTKHQWSSDGINWERPSYHNANTFGGSAKNYPRDNVDGDNREYLSFWGFKGEKGGCCSSSLAENQDTRWGLNFTMYIRTGGNAISTTEGSEVKSENL